MILGLSLPCWGPRELPVKNVIYGHELHESSSSLVVLISHLLLPSVNKGVKIGRKATEPCTCPPSAGAALGHVPWRALRRWCGPHVLSTRAPVPPPTVLPASHLGTWLLWRTQPLPPISRVQYNFFAFVSNWLGVRCVPRPKQNERLVYNQFWKMSYVT